MTRLLYLANIRLPSEKAHTHQIMQMCAAFAGAGCRVKLLHARRRNRPELQGIQDVWAYYGVGRTFEREQVPSLDWYALAERLPPRLGRAWLNLAAPLQTTTYTLALAWRLRREQADIFYSRDPLSLAVLGWLRPRLRPCLIYEAHTFPAGLPGLWLRRKVTGMVAGAVVVTGQLARLCEQLGVPADRLLVAPDGVNLARFEGLPGRAACREDLDLPRDAFLVGYVGRLHTLGMGKGLDTLVEALAQLRDAMRPVHLCLVGGPDEAAEAVRQHAVEIGLPDAVLTFGQVHPDAVPRYLHAFDVCAMPFPWTTHFAYYASPMKLFEYMASGTPIVATDLPSTAEIVRDGESALLVPPDDADALAGALRRLRDDPALGERLAARARSEVAGYTWEARAQRILHFAQEQAG
jgi:glycosyltransferase involved in cell wall biosynthesis